MRRIRQRGYALFPSERNSFFPSGGSRSAGKKAFGKFPVHPPDGWRMMVDYGFRIAFSSFSAYRTLEGRVTAFTFQCGHP
jgi:hypothetical protein